MGANDKLAATFHPASSFGQLVVEVSGPWPINGPELFVTPRAAEILVRLGWTPPTPESENTR